jgi:RNA polymerase sigma factor (sigma-70 family)
LLIFEHLMKELPVLIAEYIEGRSYAVGELYDRFKNRLLLLAYNYCQDKELSRDIVQDVFEKLLILPVEKRKEYFGTPDINILAYLTVIIKNKCIDAKRISSNREKILNSSRYPFNSSIKITSLERFSIDGLNEMLTNLQPRERQIIQLHINGYSNQEIASSLNISYNTVKNNIYDSRKKLKNLWNLFMS